MQSDKYIALLTLYIHKIILIDICIKHLITKYYSILKLYIYIAFSKKIFIVSSTLLILKLHKLTYMDDPSNTAVHHF